MPLRVVSPLNSSPLLPQSSPSCRHSKTTVPISGVTFLPIYKSESLPTFSQNRAQEELTKKKLFAIMAQLYFLVVILLFISSQISPILSATFTIKNNCDYTVWPGILSGAGTAPLSTTGFALDNSESKSLQLPTGWSGRFWGRTLCSTDSTGKFTCATGDCGSGQIQCSGSGAAPPATLAEFTLNGANGLDFYDVSLVDGYNLPILVAPQGGSGGNCSSTGCLVDVNGLCPSDLRVVHAGVDDGGSIACRSACEAFGSPEYCCSGAYGNPNTCRPTRYSEVFKNACPRAYSYAYDDGTSTFTCGNADYVITFCPNVASKKSGQNNPEVATLPLINETMVFLGSEEVSRAASRLLPISLFIIVLFVHMTMSFHNL